MFSHIETNNRFAKMVFIVMLLLVSLGRVIWFVAQLLMYPVKWFESKFLFDDSAAENEQDLKDIRETRIWFRSIMTVFILAALFLVYCWGVLG